jgi:hypothetical protein
MMSEREIAHVIGEIAVDLEKCKKICGQKGKWKNENHKCCGREWREELRCVIIAMNIYLEQFANKLEEK